MKLFLRSLILIAFFMVPAYGQEASAPVATEAANAEAPNGPILLDTQTPPAPDAQTQTADPGFPVARTVGGLGLVLCLIAGGYFAARKFAPRYFSKSTAERNLKLIETLSMGDKRSISMIEVGNSRFLIGNTPQQINLLAALPEPFSMVSEPEALPVTSRRAAMNETMTPFRNLFEVEKKRPTQYAGNPLPEDIRAKMRQLRESLER
ncbi:MAG: flagellar biosynthetic protein FliO [Acidobacteria bacterium]|nr:flagellar biosynthetic protein FliO [Acidobacteriota bacterium]